MLLVSHALQGEPCEIRVGHTSHNAAGSNHQHRLCNADAPLLSACGTQDLLAIVDSEEDDVTGEGKHLPPRLCAHFLHHALQPVSLLVRSWLLQR